ncbi:SusD/RagB family nutrient-binding outer membrane lipoprotein [Chitinophaga silvatica]|uniref:SusD/RagB family nutrient-binding outer membrane lipoprotein n=1 Tax=Chitinophaga silvatica TaxID=2282649 RepID=A0A3E1Y9W4_9BACT|nr:SusD/RagB family nutrient-binding outer membrane lipoprotein [Chitinophaga silvatica]RFS22462.1 SusD/RagB family nutrient-binding outer membrane lipoprotein [Chitinophaga silvatica]
MKRLSYILLVTFAAMVGCKKGWLDINTDPNNPTVASLPQMLVAAQQGLAYDMGFNNDNRGARGLTEVLSVYMHQVTVREDQDQYGATGTDFSINNSWNDFYSAQSVNGLPDYVGCLENISVMIAQAEAGGNHIYAGIGRIMRAYGVSQFVDAFADVPYSEANQFATNGLRYPKFDKGQDIYTDLFKQLDQGIAELQATGGNELVPSADDLFYGGSPAAWIRLANTIKLKLYNQIRLTTNVSAEVTALVNSGNLISSWSQSFLMKYGKNPSPDDRNPGFSEYFATQKSHYQSPWFFEILKGINPNIFTGITDPRIPYYFYNQNTVDGVSQGLGTDYRDSAFISIYFGSTGPNRDKSQDQSMTVFGIYPVGGRYDQGDHIVVNASSGTGAAPLRLLTYADVLYIEAELMNVGLIGGDARATLKSAILESFSQVDNVVNLANGGQTIPKLVGGPDTAYTNQVLAVYDAATTATRRLEIIITEKWIQSFGFSGDQYTDYRRTGYPIIFDPNNPQMAPGGYAQPPINGDPSNPGVPQPKVRVVCLRKYPVSLPWPATELNVNPNAPPQKTPDSYFVFWDKQ